MPSDSQGSVSGETANDAERFLDWNIGDSSGRLSREQKDRRRMALVRIASIDHLDVISDWIAVEIRLGRSEDGSGRTDVIAALNRRKAELEVYGERSDRLEKRTEPRDLPPVETTWTDRPDVETSDDRNVYRSPWTFGPLEERYPHLFDEDDAADVDGAVAADVATDGGDPTEGSK